MTRRSKSVEDAALRAVREGGNISVKNIHEWIVNHVGWCAEKEVAAALKRMVKQGLLVKQKPLNHYVLPKAL